MSYSEFLQRKTLVRSQSTKEKKYVLSKVKSPGAQVKDITKKF